MIFRSVTELVRERQKTSTDKEKRLMFFGSFGRFFNWNSYCFSFPLLERLYLNYGMFAPGVISWILSSDGELPSVLDCERRLVILYRFHYSAVRILIQRSILWAERSSMRTDRVSFLVGTTFTGTPFFDVHRTSLTLTGNPWRPSEVVDCR